MAKLSDLDIKKFGHTIQMAGAIYVGEGKSYVCYFPDEVSEDPFEPLEMDTEDWKALIRQTDLLETEILAKAENGDLVKVVVRKSTRQIEQGVSWNVFRRDLYHCRYCAKDTVPLTVDHLVLWEEGGPSIEKNLLTSCRKCNKIRGNTQYEEWLRSPYYMDVSRNLTTATRMANGLLVMTLPDIPRRIQQRSR